MQFGKINTFNTQETKEPTLLKLVDVALPKHVKSVSVPKKTKPIIVKKLYEGAQHPHGQVKETKSTACLTEERGYLTRQFSWFFKKSAPMEDNDNTLFQVLYQQALDLFNKHNYMVAWEKFHEAWETSVDNPLEEILCLERMGLCHIAVAENQYTHVIVLSDLTPIPSPDLISHDAIIVSNKRLVTTKYWNSDNRERMLHNFDHSVLPKKFRQVVFLPEYCKHPELIKDSIVLVKDGFNVSAMWEDENKIFCKKLDFKDHPQILERFPKKRGNESNDKSYVDAVVKACEITSTNIHEAPGKIFLLFRNCPPPEKIEDIPDQTIVIHPKSEYFRTVYWKDSNNIYSKQLDLRPLLNSKKVSAHEIKIIFRKGSFECMECDKSQEMIDRIQVLFGCRANNYIIEDNRFVLDVVLSYSPNFDYKKTLKYYDKAIALAEMHLEGVAKVNILNDLIYLKSRVLIKLGLHNKAEDTLCRYFKSQSEEKSFRGQNTEIIKAIEEIAHIIQVDRVDSTKDKNPELKADEKSELSHCQTVVTHYSSAKALVAQKRYTEALSHFNCALEHAFINKDNIWFHRSLINEILCDKACVHQYLGHYASLQQCLRLIQAQPNIYRIVDGEYGIFWATMNKWEFTNKLLNNGPEVALLIAQTYSELGDYKEALYYYDKCLDVENSLRYLSLCKDETLETKETHLATLDEKIVNLDTNKNLKKQKAYEMLICRMPVEWWIHKSFAFFCADLIGHARICVEDGLKFNPGDQHLLFIKAVVLLHQNQALAADALLEQVLKTSKVETYEYVMALLGKGLVLAVNNHEAAKTYFQQAEKAILSCMLREQLHYYLIKGKILAVQGLDKLANVAFETALKLKPDYIPVLREVKPIHQKHVVVPIYSGPRL